MNELPLNEIIHGDCLEVMRQFPDKSIDMILCDLPYGTTACKWDTVIPFEPLWEQYGRIIKDNGAIVLFGMQPFTSALVMSNKKIYRYNLVWEKTRPTLFQHAWRMPLRNHEDIVVFYKKAPTYNPQGLVKQTRKVKRTTGGGTFGENWNSNNEYMSEYANFPRSIIKIPSETKTMHPTQKPVALFEYLIKTYTNEGDIVLDNCIGSGTTAIACINTGRNFIGIEIEEKYVKIARERIEKHKKLDKRRLFPISELETGNKGLTRI